MLCYCAIIMTKQCKEAMYPGQSASIADCRGGMIEVYKYLHGQYNVDVSFLPRTKNSNRGHSLKLQKQSSELKVRHDFFSLRVVDLWNS